MFLDKKCQQYNTGNRLLTINFSTDDIANILQNLDPSKANGHDKISIYMLQLFGNTISESLELISNSHQKVVLFRLHGKKETCISAANLWKKIEKVIFNEMPQLFIESELILPNQSGFKSGDSCIN